MAWQRKIPFGYTMKKGEIQCSPTESAAVKEIFRLYADGMAYSKIAAEMMRRGLRYHSRGKAPLVLRKGGLYQPPLHRGRGHPHSPIRKAECAGAEPEPLRLAPAAEYK